MLSNMACLASEKITIERLMAEQADSSENQPESNIPEGQVVPPVPKRMARSIAGMQDPAEHGAVARANPERLQKAFELACMAAQMSEDSKAEKILVLDMRKLTSMLDFFVIATVPSRRQAGAIAGQLELEMKKRKEQKMSVETSETGRWTLLDYGDVVIHLFSPEGREFYNLEDVWGDAPRLDWKDASLKIQ